VSPICTGRECLMVVAVRFVAMRHYTRLSVLRYAASFLVLVAPLSYSQVFQIVHNFGGPGDGWQLNSSVVFDSSGNIYGTASFGGQYISGVAYQLSPTDNGWQENILHNFGGPNDGSIPFGEILVGQNGVLYGTTLGGRNLEGSQIAYSLAPGTDSWAESILYTFGFPPELIRSANLVQDALGNLYGAFLYCVITVIATVGRGQSCDSP